MFLNVIKLIKAIFQKTYDDIHTKYGDYYFLLLIYKQVVKGMCSMYVNTHQSLFPSVRGIDDPLVHVLFLHSLACLLLGLIWKECHWCQCKLSIYVDLTKYDFYRILQSVKCLIVWYIFNFCWKLLPYHNGKYITTTQCTTITSFHVLIWTLLTFQNVFTYFYF